MIDLSDGGVLSSVVEYNSDKIIVLIGAFINAGQLRACIGGEVTSCVGHKGLQRK